MTIPKQDLLTAVPLHVTGANVCWKEAFSCLLCKLMIGEQLLQVSGKQFLLHREPNPGSGLPHIRFNLTDVLNMSADK